MRPEQKEHFLFFHAVGNFIIPTDELIFSEGWLNHQPDNYGIHSSTRMTHVSSKTPAG